MNTETVEITREIEIDGVYEPYRMVRFVAKFSKQSDNDHDVLSDVEWWGLDDYNVYYDDSERPGEISDIISPSNLEWLKSQAHEELMEYV